MFDRSRERGVRRLVTAAMEMEPASQEAAHRAIVRKYPRSAYAVAMLAAYLVEAKSAEASHWARHTVLTESGDPVAVYTAANLLAMLEESEDAAWWAGRARELAVAQGNAFVLESLVAVDARVAAGRGDLERAEELYRRFAASDPLDWLRLVPYLEFLAWQDRRAEAVALIDALPPNMKDAQDRPAIRADLAG